MMSKHHDDLMRTTLTLDPDVATMVDEEVHRSRKPFKQVVNDGLRRGLSSGRRGAGRPLIPAPHHAKLQPGFDPATFNRLADELDDLGTLAKAKNS
jgi:hypothetical protein